MKILIDGMGGDNAPEVIVEGAIMATKYTKENMCIIGDEEKINKIISKYGYKGEQISVLNATEKIENDESPVRAIRRKKDSSIVKGINMLNQGEGDVLISAGSTGALLAGGHLIIGCIDGIERPALATVYPILGKEPSLLLDAGANVECKAHHLLQFAIMGSIYMEEVIGKKNPVIGLVNNGVEAGKGNTLTKEAYKLISKTDLNFMGNLEARDIPLGLADVIVADGFTGNIVLKLSEGLALTLMRELKYRFTSTGVAKLGAAMLKSKLLSLKEEVDYKEYGGAPILGLNKALLKMHGSSDGYAVMRTIMKSIPYVNENVVEKISDISNKIVEISKVDEECHGKS
ncbi:phosphate acyltransferase PlsX [Eubacteriales bacterium KG127]